MINDSDPSVVRVRDTHPSIRITKTADDGDDTQTVSDGDRARFRITVRNTGSEDLIDVRVTDERAPDCDATFARLDVGEREGYTCRGTSRSGSYTNVADVRAR